MWTGPVGMDEGSVSDLKEITLALLQWVLKFTAFPFSLAFFSCLFAPFKKNTGHLAGLVRGASSS